MAEAVWHYAKGDDEFGPITTAKLKALADAGQIKPDDLVWKVGMDDWKPAGNIPGLLGREPAMQDMAEAPKSSGAVDTTPPAQLAPSAGGTAPPKSSRKTDIASNARNGKAGMFNLLSFGNRIGQPLLLLGLLLAMVSRGCDTVGQLGVDRLKAKQELVLTEFNQTWDDKELAIQDSEDNAAQKSQQLDKLRTERRKAGKKLRKRTKSIARKIDNAEPNRRIWRWYYGMAFQLGTMLLTLGLLAVGFTATGPERWVCMMILAIIILGLFGGGSIAIVTR